MVGSANSDLDIVNIKKKKRAAASVIEVAVQSKSKVRNRKIPSINLIFIYLE